MKIGLITDTHFSYKKANKSFHDYFAKFYNDVFFPKLQKNNIQVVIHLGDSFDNRRGVDYWSLDWAKENFYDKLEQLGITLYSIVGNHDAYFKTSNDVNAIDLLLNQYENVVKISSPSEHIIFGKNVLFLPWICSDNEKESFQILENTKSKLVFGHLELNGFYAYPGHIRTEGLNKEIFKKFDRVFSGHYHTKSDDGKIFYLGNPYQMNWNDLNDKRGFHIFDLENYQIDYFQNPYNIFEKIYYTDEYIETDFSVYSEKIVKIVVEKKEDILRFEKFVDNIIFQNPLELKIIENTDIYDGDVNLDEILTEDTLTILNKYVEESDFDLDKKIVKKLLREIYKQSLETE